MQKFLVASFLLLCACTPTPSPPSQDEAQEVADKMVYVKSKTTGICFGVINGRSVTAQGSGSISATYVPCTAVEHLLPKEN